MENGSTEEQDFEKGGSKHAAVLFVFCAAAERVLLEKKCCGPLAKVEELARNAQGISNFLLREAIMPNVQQLIGEFVEKLIEAIDDEKNGPTTRFQANSLFNDIKAFINDADPDEPDSIDERGSLHIVIPNESYSLPESAIEFSILIKKNSLFITSNLIAVMINLENQPMVITLCQDQITLSPKAIIYRAM